MNKNILKNDLLLLLTAIIWGSAFVAQSVGMDYIGPFYFNGLRFILGALSLLPLIYVRIKRKAPVGTLKQYLVYGVLSGICLFGGASLQQIGIIYTTAGNAGFITGLYVILVPLSAVFWKQKTPARVWAGAVLAALGLYLLSITSGFSMTRGDIFVLTGTLFWTAHFHVLSWASPKVDSLILSVVQFLFCAIASLSIAFFTEPFHLQSLGGAILPIFYGGLMSVGVAYTLQVIAQREAPASHAAIILSLEGAFAALGGLLFLQEVFSTRQWIGCSLMFAGMILAQLDILSLINKKKGNRLA